MATTIATLYKQTDKLLKEIDDVDTEFQIMLIDHYRGMFRKTVDETLKIVEEHITERRTLIASIKKTPKIITTIVKPYTPDGIQLDTIVYKKVTKNNYHTYITKNGKLMASAGLAGEYEDISIGERDYEYVMDEIKEEQMYLKEDMSLTMEDVDRPDIQDGNTYDGSAFDALHEDKVNLLEYVEDVLFCVGTKLDEDKAKRLDAASKCYEKTDEELRTQTDEWITIYLANVEYKEKAKPAILRALNALDKHDRKYLKQYQRKFICTFDAIKYADFERYLIEEKILIRTSNNVLQIVKAKNTVTLKDNYNSMILLRNVMKITQRTIDNSEFGTVMGKIAWLAANDDTYVKSDDELNYDYNHGYEYAFGSDNGITDDMINELKDHLEEKVDVEIISVDEVDSIED